MNKNMKIVCAAFAGLVTLGMAVTRGATASPSAAKVAAPQVLTVSGYPIDRSIEALAKSDVDFIVVVSGISAGIPRWTTPNGEAPSYIVEGRAPSESESINNVWIETPVTGRVTKVIRGSLAVGSSFSSAIVGGTVKNVTMNAGDELAPDMIALRSGPVVVAGRTVNGSTEITYAYSLRGDSLKALLSGGPNRSDRKLRELESLATEK